MMKLLLSLGLLLPAAAMPPSVGSTPENVRLTQVSNFSDGSFQNLNETELALQPANIQVLVYLTPW